MATKGDTAASNIFFTFKAWRKLYEACNKEHMVICIEITDDNHAPSRRVQPLIVDLAREISQIPFFRVKVGFGRTYDQVSFWKKILTIKTFMALVFFSY